MNIRFNLFPLSSCKFTKKEERQLLSLSASESFYCSVNKEMQIDCARLQAEIILRGYERAQANT